METTIDLKTNASVIYDIACQFESGKLNELTKEKVRKSYKKLGLKDNFHMKEIVDDLQTIYGENSINMRGSRRWAWYTLANGISNIISPEIKEKLLKTLEKDATTKQQIAAEKQEKIINKAAKKAEQEQKKEEIIDPVKDYCSVMGISIKDMNPEVVKKFPKPVKRGEEYKHNNIPTKKEMKNCAIFLHNIKELLKPKESLLLDKEAKWKATKGTSSDFITHLFVCYIYRFPTVDFRVTEGGKLEISRLTKEDCDIIINEILNDLKDYPEYKIVETHIKNNKSLTFEEIIIQYPEVEKPKEKVIVTLDSVKLYKIGNAVFNGAVDIPTVEEYIRNNYTTLVSVEDIKTGLSILSEGGLMKNEKTTEETDMKLLELIEKLTPDFNTNVTICSMLTKSALELPYNVSVTLIGTSNGINIYNAVVNVECKEHINSLLNLMMKQRTGEKVILPPCVVKNLKQRFGTTNSSLEDHLSNLLKQVKMI